MTTGCVGEYFSFVVNLT